MSTNAIQTEIFIRRKEEFINEEFMSKKKYKQYEKYVACFDKEFDVENIDFFILAVALGYNDAKRTLKGIGKIWKKDQNLQTSFFKAIAINIQQLFKNQLQDFDTWHQHTCLSLRDYLKDTDVNITYGHAQKIINMAFKYLYCMKDADKYNAIFEQCHMPLDSFTLEWYKRTDFYKKCKTPNTKLKCDDTWSKMNVPEKYQAISQLIKSELEKEQPFYVYNQEIILPSQPLFAEFIIWPEMQLHLAAEDFIFTYNDKENLSQDENTKIKTEIKMKNLDEKLFIIEELINTYKNKYKSNITT